MSDRVPLVCRQVIKDDHIALVEGRGQLGFDVGLEYIGCHGTVDDPGRGQAVVAQCRDKGEGLPVSVRNWSNHPLSTWTTPSQARHLGINPGLVDKDDVADPAWVRQ